MQDIPAPCAQKQTTGAVMIIIRKQHGTEQNKKYYKKYLGGTDR